MTRDEIIDLICRKADQWGIDRAEFLGGAIAESELNPAAARWGNWPDVSFGLFQQTVKFAEEGDHSNSEQNITYIRNLYSDPEYACDVAAKKYLYWRHDPDVPALTAWIAYNSPGYYRTPGTSPNRANYERGLTEAATIVAGLPQEPAVPNLVRLHTTDDVRLRDAPTTDSNIMATLPKGTLAESPDVRAWRRIIYQGRGGWVAADFLEDAPTEEPPSAPIPSAFFNPEFPVGTQEHDWDCAQDSLWWILHALGRKPDNTWMEDELLKAGIETTEWGLMDATGARLAAWVIEQYHPDLTAYNIPDLSFDRATELAGTTGFMAGARNWYNGEGHWVAIRRARNGGLELANPGGQFSQHFGEQFLDRAAWEAKGPWSGVVVERKA
jgi:uncharacterized protein YgiM (DUF1202 family)